MITYPVDTGNTKWSVYQISTASIIARRKDWPVLGGGEITSLDSDYVMLEEKADAQPSVDSRIWRLEGTDVIDVDGNSITRTWATYKRVPDEIKNSAVNIEAEQLGLHINLQRELMETRLMVGALLNYVDGLTMPAKVQAQADQYKTTAIKLWKNRDRLKAIIDQIDADQEPDMDSGWEPVD